MKSNKYWYLYYVFDMDCFIKFGRGAVVGNFNVNNVLIQEAKTLKRSENHLKINL